MNLPRIHIEHGDLLEMVLTGLIRKYDPLFNQPDKEKTAAKIDLFKSEWEKIEQDYLAALEDQLGLKFSERDIYAYVSGIMHGSGMSVPLIVSSAIDTKRFPIVLAHELIHRLLARNTSYSTDVLGQIRDEIWPDDTDIIKKNHIVVLAVLEDIYINILDLPEEISKERQYYEAIGAKSYVDAWLAVDAVGRNETIQRFREVSSIHAGR
ncbi:MAG TPA: hypothetical protein VF696_01090 [Candidatus Paceibacterota bacterium]|jgi:hypothetical protein